VANDRIKYSEAHQSVLLSQVNRVCTLCAKPQYYKNKSQTYEDYQLAHVYRLNTKPEELNFHKCEVF